MYISAIRNLHVTSGQHLYFTDQLTPRVEQVLRGIKKEQSFRLPMKICLPITIQIMRQIKDLLLQTSHDYKSILMWVVCCTTFFGFLRCSEFTVLKEQDYNCDIHLAYANVAIDCKENPQILQLHNQKRTDLERV